MKELDSIDAKILFELDRNCRQSQKQIAKRVGATRNIVLHRIKTMEEAEKLLNEMEKEREEVEVKAGVEGLVLKADTLGSLEALKKIFYAHSIRSATVGRITKKDVIEAEANKDRFHKLVIGFNSELSQENEQLAKDVNVKIIKSDAKTVK